MVYRQYTMDGKFVAEYRSAQKAADAVKTCSKHQIIRCANGMYDTVGGFKWKHQYKEATP